MGFAIALLHATKRADRRQHRGLSLASFAVGLAALLWAVSFIGTTVHEHDVHRTTGGGIHGTQGSHDVTGTDDRDQRPGSTL